MNSFLTCMKEAQIPVFCQEPMQKHTTFRTGGPADYYIIPEKEEDLKTAIQALKEADIPYFLLGNGSNLLVSDAGWRGAILQIGKNFSEVTVEGRRISAGAGILLASLASAALKNSLTGLEFASGIPGTLGGGLVMNAGAYGGELKQVVTRAHVLNEAGEDLWLSTEELDMGYRRSCILPKHYIALGAELMLEPGDPEQIRKTMQDLADRRKEKQPLEYPSAGSTFKRPEGYFAGKLIQDAGLAGYSVGGACVSEKHCGFVINKGGATSSDIMTLCRNVKEIVMEKYGVALEMEVRTLGDFS